MLQALSMREIDVSIMSATVASYYIDLQGITNLRIAGNTGLKMELAVAIKKEKAPLQSIVNKVLASISEEERTEMHKRWIYLDGIGPRQKARIWRYIFIAVLIVLLLAAITWFWITQLRRLVSKKTKELQDERNALEASREQYKKLFDGAFSAILLFNSRQILHYNTFALDLFGYEAQEIKGKSFLSLSASEGSEKVMHKRFFKLLDTLRNKGGVISSWKFLNSVGELVETQVSLSRVVMPDDTEVFQAIILDLTAERERHRRIESLAARLALATDVAGVGIWELSLPEKLVCWESSMFSIYEVDGLPENSSLETWAGFIHPEDKRMVRVTVDNVIRQGGTLDLVFRIITGKGNEKFVKAYGKVLTNKETETETMLGTN